MIENALEIFLFIICIILSAFFSSSEVALISMTRARVRTLDNENRVGSHALVALKESPEHLLTTILIGNNIVNVAAAALATAIAIQWFGDIGVGIATGFVVIILLVFGEIAPKIYATRAPDSFALTIAPIILFLSKVFTPVLWLVERMTPKLGLGKDGAEPSVTEEEIKEWIDVGKEEGTIEQDEQDMLYSVLEFGDTTAREIMTPRVDVVLMEDTVTFDDAIRIFNETGFSRIPVYHDQIDNITGILNVKDVFAAMVSRRKNANISEVMYDPLFVPETKKIDDLLKELQVHRVQMAVVIDEYSSFVGIVTVEDILEELVGDIMDEYDKEDPVVQEIAPGVFVVDAQMWIDDANDRMGINLPEDESYETIGGLLIDRLGHLPLHPGEKAELQEQNITLSVMQMHGRRIVKVKVLVHAAHGNGKKAADNESPEEKSS
ncbi:MAG: hemolysin family protein [Methanoregula sp.]|jgi:CBS domain containing-hemolysin-like protein|uniref:hemolysin family protein n=1 Tax=Methanoregula sp. TaxID=2052170 RepID=UPI0025E31D83|nr:hemolysin family protein [Methanoregula sp.]MCK9630091.1 hemolysin family protein [Methanoregula sp.]